uniref:Proteasome assembly chaperone 1 n=1 Tax=Erpetoichthys calabaricus TaxID=27687 RepID=A0A8C4X7T7_ERPCA
MATFFGETVILSSRAVDEEDEEEEVEDENEEDREIKRELEKKREVHLHWNADFSRQFETSSDKTLQISELIIAVGYNASGFLSAFALSSGKWETVGNISLWNEKSRFTRETSLEHPGEPSCIFYRKDENPEVLICQCTCYVAEDQLFQWAAKVLGCIEKRSLKVTILSDCPVANYRSPEYISAIPVPFLKALKTRTYNENLCCSPLEQPNVVSGIPAAVLSYCQVHQIPAVLYQCYTDVVKLDSVTIETYKSTLSCSSLRKLIKPCTALSTEILKKLTEDNETQSNLYT